MASLGEKFTKTFTTFSGIDITAIFDDKTILTVSGVSVSITREKAPVYTFGSATPRSISRGKRGIAGSIVATLFDRHSMMEMFLDPRKWYYAHRNEVNWLRNPTNASNPARVRPTGNDKLAELQAERSSGAGRDIDPSAPGSLAPNLFSPTLGEVSVEDVAAGTTAGAFQRNVPGALGGVGGFNSFNAQRQNNILQPGQIVDGQAVTVRRSAVYADQILPFDLTLVAQNEYGQAAWSSVNACEFINEGMGMSVDDITSEQQFTFIAIHCEPWRPLDPAGQELQNVGAQTSFGIDDEGQIAVDSDSGPISPDWAPFYARSIDGNLRVSGAGGAVITSATAALGQQLVTAGTQGFTPTPL